MKAKTGLFMILALSLSISCKLSVDPEEAKQVTKGITEGVIEGVTKGAKGSKVSKVSNLLSFVADNAYEEGNGAPNSVSRAINTGKGFDDIYLGPKQGYKNELAILPISTSELNGMQPDMNASVFDKTVLKENQPYQILESSLNKLLQENNKGIYGINNDGSIYSIQYAQTGIPSNFNSPTFINSRYIAYRKAELLAKLDILSTVCGAILTSSTDFSEFERQIGEIIQIDTTREQNEITLSGSDFSEVLIEQYGGLLKGCNVIKMVEGDIGNNDYQVAVAVKFSPKLWEMAENMNNLSMKSGESSSSEIINQIAQMSSDELITNLGARIYYFNNRPIIVGYGQSGINSSSSTSQRIAGNAAKLRATNMIKTFLAESLVGNTSSKSYESVQQLNEKKQTNNAGYSGSSIMSRTYSEFEKSIKSAESSLKMNTIAIRSWTGVHPINGARIAGSIVALMDSETFNSFKNNSNLKETSKSGVLESKVRKNQDF